MNWDKFHQTILVKPTKLFEFKSEEIRRVSLYLASELD